MTDDVYELYAVRYAHHDRKATENFLGGDPHDILQPLAYFVWAIVGPGRTFVVDTGFDRAMANARGRTIVKPVEEGLETIGIRADAVKDVIVTHLHFDHAGGLTRRSDAGPVRTFLNAEIIVQKREWEDAIANNSVMTRTYLRDHLRNAFRGVEALGELRIDEQTDFHDPPFPSFTPPLPQDAVQEDVHPRRRRFRQIVREQRETMRAAGIDRQFGLVARGDPPRVHE